MHKNLLRYFLITVWIISIAAVIHFYAEANIPLKELPGFLKDHIANYGSIKAALIYIAIYTLAALFFFPPIPVLHSAAGLLFGPFWGIFLAIIGQNMCANFGFLVGRYLGRNFIEKQADHFAFVEKINNQLQKYGFITTLIFRLMYIPFDVINYICGLSAMKQRDFALGSLIGGLPGIISFVFLGSSPDEPINLIISLIIFIIGVGLAVILKKRHKHLDNKF